jgi:predicted transposase YdaD
MKTDKLFYRIFLSQPELIAELLSGIPAGCEFEYSAPVVKEKEVRLDGLLMPKSDDLAVPLVFLEAQMQPDEGFYGRFFAIEQFGANFGFAAPAGGARCGCGGGCAGNFSEGG